MPGRASGAVITPSARGRGGRSIRPGSAGSRPSASAGRISVPEVDREDLHDRQRERDRAAAQREDEERDDLRRGVGEDVDDELADVVEDLTSRLDRRRRSSRSCRR